MPVPMYLNQFTALYVSRYLAAYQLGHTGNAWDPFFGDGTEIIITSDVSKAWPVPDAGLGAGVPPKTGRWQPVHRQNKESG